MMFWARFLFEMLCLTDYHFLNRKSCVAAAWGSLLLYVGEPIAEGESRWGLYNPFEGIMSADAKLYEVRGTHGTVYAVHVLDANMFWTERTEEAARELAKQKSLNITGQGTISRDELLGLMGQPPALKTKVASAPSAGAQQPTPPPVNAAKMPTQWPKIKFEPLDETPILPPAPEEDVVVAKKKEPDAILGGQVALSPEKRNVFSRAGAPLPNKPTEPDLLTGRRDVSHHTPPRGS